MKNLLFITTFLFAGLCLNAQTLPNADFETWLPGADYEVPEGWNTSNEISYQFPFNGITVEKTSDAYSGSSAARVVSMDMGGGNVLPGFISTARITLSLSSMTGEMDGGVYFPYRPGSITGYFKYAPASPDDFCMVGALLLKYNVEGEAPDTVGGAYFSSTGTVDSYTMFTATFQYLSADIPDSLSLTITSTDPENPVAGSVVIVDDMSAVIYNGLSIPLMEEESFVWPNPVSDGDVVNLKVNEDALVSVYNLNGQLLKLIHMEEGTQRLDLSGLSSGQYIIRKEEKSQADTQIITIQ